MSDHEYRGGPDPAGMWGCAVAALIGVPIAAYLIFVDALGDCASDTDCHKGFWSNVGLPAAAVFAVLFLTVRWAAKSLRSDD